MRCTVSVTIVDPEGHVHRASCGYPRSYPTFTWWTPEAAGIASTEDDGVTWMRGHPTVDDPQLAALRVAAALSDRRAPVLDVLGSSDDVLES